MKNKNTAVCVFDDAPIGVDIQYFHNVKHRNKYKFFSEKENIYVNCDRWDVSKKYIQIFVKKEAAIKMLAWAMAQAAIVDAISNKYFFTSK